MAHLYKLAATLRIFGDSLIPDEITAILGCNPSASYFKGQIFHSKSGDVIRRTGMWSLETEDCNPENLDGQVAVLLGKLTADLGVWASLCNQFKIDLFCGLFMRESNEGLEVSPQTLRALGERGILLGLDIYAPSKEEKTAG